MHRAVTRQAFRSKPRQRFDNHGLAKRDLILDDHVDGRMQRQPGYPDAAPTMVGLDEGDALL